MGPQGGLEVVMARSVLTGGDLCRLLCQGAKAWRLVGSIRWEWHQGTLFTPGDRGFRAASEAMVGMEYLGLPTALSNG